MQNLQEPTMETGAPSDIPQMMQFDTTGDEMEHLHYDQTSVAAQENPQQIEQLPSVLPNSRKPKARNSTQPKRTLKGPKQRPWKDTETSALLKFVNLPKFRHPRRTRGTVAWELIVEAIHGELGSPDPAITAKRCKERMKTLTGDRYYKQARSNWEKKNLGGNLTQDDWHRELQHCGLTVEWYEAIEEYMQGRPSQGQGVSRMQMQCDVGRKGTTDGPSSSDIPAVNEPSEPVSAMVPAQNLRKSAKNEIARRFKSLNDLQRSTLLDLVFCSYNERTFICEHLEFDVCSRICEWLSIVQNRRESAVYDDVVVLEEKRLVRFLVGSEVEPGDQEPRFAWSCVEVYEEFLTKVIARNPAYDTRRRVVDKTMVRFDSSCARPGITVLNLLNCEELKEVDLSGFRMLRCLSIYNCPKLDEIIWCEELEELGSLEIVQCPSYHGYPPVQRFTSLQEFVFWPVVDFSSVPRRRELDLSGCVRLRRLQICHDHALSSVHGLEGLRSLAVVSLTVCPFLENLPDIGHMTDLTYLGVAYTALEEIKGVEKLSRLEVLACHSSKLKTLPDLSHLPHLQSVYLYACPVTLDPSSPYYRKTFVELNKSRYVDVREVSDDEGDASDEEGDASDDEGDVSC